jgi:hypothetical protein
MARSPFRRFILVGGALAVAAAGAYVKRDRVRQLLPGTSADAPQPSYSPPPPPAPSNYDAPGPPANTATPVPAPDPVVMPDPARSDPIEDFPVQADDPQAAAAAVDAAAADALAEGIGAVDEPGLQGAPEPIDEVAEEQAAAAEAAAIGGPTPEYASSQIDEPITEAERPLAEAGEGVSEGQEQAEAELEENAEFRDDGMSDAERQIDDTIEAAGNPYVGETPDPVRPSEDAGKVEGDDDDDISGGDWQTWSGGAVKPQ